MAGNSVTTDFNGQEGTVVYWARSLDGYTVNVDNYDYNLFRVRALYSGVEYIIETYIPDPSDTGNNGHLNIDYQKGNVTSDRTRITDTDFPSTNWQMVAVSWSYATGGHQLKYYLNGALVSTSSDIFQWPTTVPTSIDITAGPARHVLGHMALWNKPLASTDISNIYSRGSAFDAVTVFPEIGGAGAKLTFYNPTGTTCYLTKLQLRGKRIKQYRSVDAEAVDDVSYARFGESAMSWDMQYETDPVFGRLFADYLVSKTSSPGSQIDQVSFIANVSDDIYRSALALEPGDRITISEAQTGINSDFFVNGIGYKMTGADMLEVTLFVIAADSTQAWNIGVAGYSEIGEATYLAL